MEPSNHNASITAMKAVCDRDRFGANKRSKKEWQKVEQAQLDVVA